MKVYHLLIAVLIVAAIFGVFTVLPGGGGFIYDMRYDSEGATSYNDQVNLSTFTGYDYTSDVKDQIETLNSSLTQPGTSDEDTEQNIFSRFWQSTKDMGQIFTGAYNLVNKSGKDLGVPITIIFIVTTLIALFILVRTIGGWFFNR